MEHGSRQERFKGRRRGSTEEVPTQLVCDNHEDVINDLGIDEAEDEGSRPEEPVEVPARTAVVG